MDITRRVVITGGPGTGKSTILKYLEDLGYPTHGEVSRSVIKEELERSSEILPWRDLSGFSEKVFQGQTAQYHQALEGKVNFYDRGMIDVIAYLRKDKLNHDQLSDLVPHYPYFKKVFLTPPWPEIYQQDNERREDTEEMHRIHQSLMETYVMFDYDVHEIPRDNTEERVNFVLRHLELL